MRSSQGGRRAHAVPVVAWLALPAIALVRRRREHDPHPPSALMFDGPEAHDRRAAFAELGCLPPEEQLVS